MCHFWDKRIASSMSSALLSVLESSLLLLEKCTAMSWPSLLLSLSYVYDFVHAVQFGLEYDGVYAMEYVFFFLLFVCLVIFKARSVLHGYFKAWWILLVIQVLRFVFFQFFFSVPLNFVPFFKRRSIACFWVNGLLGLCCTMLCVLDINITRNRNDLQHFSWMNHGWYEGNGINNAWCQYHVTLTSFLREEEFMNADFSFIIFLLFHFFSCFVTAVTFL